LDKSVKVTAHLGEKLKCFQKIGSKLDIRSFDETVKNFPPDKHFWLKNNRVYFRKYG
jgi:hypothetical protein